MNRYLKWFLISTTAFIFMYWLFEGNDTAWSFFIAVVAGWYFSRTKKSKVDNVTLGSKDDSVDEEVDLDEVDLEDNSDISTEAARVRKEAEKAKERAMKSGIPQLISELYHENIHYYPSWIKHTPRDYVPDIITEALESKVGKDKKDCVVLKMNGRNYKFIYESHYSYAPGDDSSFGDLELFFNNEKVLHVNEIVSHNEWGSDHRPISVDAFVSGEWVNDFKQLKDKINEAEELRKKKEFEDPEEIEKLKKNFDIK